DSLGWALYKLSQFEEAVRYLRRAADLNPDEAVIQDHLGDAFWKVSRRGEAYRAWERARSLTQDKVDLAKIEEKIRYGITERVAQPTVSQLPIVPRAAVQQAPVVQPTPSPAPVLTTPLNLPQSIALPSSTE